MDKVRISPSKLTITSLIFLLPGLSLLYLVRFSIGPVPTNLFEILIYSAALHTTVTSVKSWKLSIKEMWWVGTSVAIIGIAVGISSDTIVALGIIKGWILPAAIIYWLLQKRLQSEEGVPLMLGGMVSQGVLVASLALLQMGGDISKKWVSVFPDTAQYLAADRSPAFFNSPNAAAMILVPSFLISYAALRSKHRWLLLILLLAGLAATGSRAGIIAAVVGVVVWQLWQRVSAKVALLTAGIAALVVNPVVASYMALRTPHQADIHIHIWQKSWEMLLESPILGYGLESFQETFRSFTLHQVNFDEFITPYAVHPHNMFLYTWFLFGFAGLAMLVFGLQRALTSAVHQNTHYSRLGAVILVAMVIQGMVDNTLWKNDLVIWFVVALILAGRVKHPVATTD